ncbi:hypothetical protein CIB84_006774 [Bambusicola thoracicus]|uniref:Uncharacterized protein n=1 Tax=Bambusicola thoracicus TaxID=9083 RepID=A0A2P4SZD3_BAMTH|nr:hypothetical protein CIB84_006774 [Bambusicola thoracicus]
MFSVRGFCLCGGESHRCWKAMAQELLPMCQVWEKSRIYNPN